MPLEFDEKYDVILHNEIRWILEDYIGEFENKRKCVDAIIVKVKELIKLEEKVKQLSELSNSLVDVENILTNRIRELENEIKKLTKEVKWFKSHKIIVDEFKSEVRQI